MIIFAKDQNKIQSIIDSLKNDFILTNEGDVKSFLGVKITHNDDRTMEFTQPSLIQNVLRHLKLTEDCKMHDTPAEMRPPTDFN